MAHRHARVDRGQNSGGISKLGRRDYVATQKRRRRWLDANQAIAVYKTTDGNWLLVRPSVYADAGILGCFRFSEQREIADSVLAGIA